MVAPPHLAAKAALGIGNRSEPEKKTAKQAFAESIEMAQQPRPLQGAMTRMYPLKATPSGQPCGPSARKEPSEKELACLGDFPYLGGMGNDAAACMRAVAALFKRGLLSAEVNEYLRDVLVMNNRTAVEAMTNAIQAFGMPDFFSPNDLADAFTRIHNLATSK